MNFEQLLAKLQEMSTGTLNALRKDWSEPGDSVSGIAGYSLESPAKILIPVITPLRNQLPRVNAVGGVAANWRAVVAINTNGITAGVAEGTRGGVPATTVTPYSANYVSLGLEDFVTFEADLASQNFQDVKALATQLLLWNLMIQEEAIILGGNTSYGLGTTPTPTVVAADTGGALTVGAKNVICIALTFDGYRASTVAAGVPATTARTNIDGTVTTFNAGAGQKSAAGTGTIGAVTTGKLTATVAPVRGAVAYAWYWGASGSELLGAITTINSVVITDVAAGTQNASAHSAADHSQNAYVHDGYLTFAGKSSYGALYGVQATGTPGTGTPLTADTEGGCVEIDADLKAFWDNLRLSPDQIWVSSQEQKNISKIVLKGASTSAHRFNFNVDQGTIAGGVMVKSYLNKYTMNGAQEIPIKLHPNMPPGTILYITKNLPYPLSNVQNVQQIRTRRDYHQLEWPIRTRRWEYGVYTDQVLQHYFIPSIGIRQNIADGVGTA
jgi:hypothetical protein